MHLCNIRMSNAGVSHSNMIAIEHILVHYHNEQKRQLLHSTM
jgi:hypothetical protein